jgi:hypothetical protein
MAGFVGRLLPRSLYAQILLVVALTLFVAQCMNAAILFSGLRSRNMLEAATQLTARVASYADRQMDRAPPRFTRDARQNRRAKRTRHPGISVVEGRAPLTIPAF